MTMYTTQNAMTRAAITNQWQPEFTVAQNWASFDKFKINGSAALDPIGKGKLGKLRTKTGEYFILEGKDFQLLYGLAQDVQRLRSGLRVVMTAVQAVQQHKDDSTLETLFAAVAMLESRPALPSRDGHAPIEPEGLDVDVEDDGYELDPRAVHSPLAER